MSSQGYYPQSRGQQHQRPQQYTQGEYGRSNSYNTAPSPGGHGRGQGLYDGSGYGEHDGYGYDEYNESYNYAQNGHWDQQYQQEPYSAGVSSQQDPRFPVDQRQARTYNYDERYRTNGREAAPSSVLAMQNNPMDARSRLPSHEKAKKQKRERILTEQPPSPKAVAWDNPFGAFPGAKKDSDSKKQVKEANSRNETPTPSVGGSRPSTSQGNRSRNDQQRPGTSHSNHFAPIVSPAQQPSAVDQSSQRRPNPGNSFGNDRNQDRDTSRSQQEPSKISLPARPAPQRSVSSNEPTTSPIKSQLTPRLPPMRAESYNDGGQGAQRQVSREEFDDPQTAYSSNQQGHRDAFPESREQHKGFENGQSFLPNFDLSLSQSKQAHFDQREERDLQNNQAAVKVHKEAPETDFDMPNFAAMAPGRTETVEQEVTMQKPIYQKQTYRPAAIQQRSDSKVSAPSERGGTPADGFHSGFVSREQTPISAISDRTREMQQSPFRGISPPISHPAMSPPIERQQTYQPRTDSHGGYRNQTMPTRTVTPSRQVASSFQHPYNQPPIPDTSLQRPGDPANRLQGQSSDAAGMRQPSYQDRNATFERNPENNQAGVISANQPRAGAGNAPNSAMVSARQRGYDTRLIAERSGAPYNDEYRPSELPAIDSASRNAIPATSRQQTLPVRTPTAASDSYARSMTPMAAGFGHNPMPHPSQNFDRSRQHEQYHPNDGYADYVDEYDQEPTSATAPGGSYPFHPDDYSLHHTPSWNVTGRDEYPPTPAQRHPQNIPYQQPRSSSSLPHSDASHPAPVRPGLMSPPPQPQPAPQNPDQQQNSKSLGRPPPVAQEVEKPVTVAELNNLREMFRTNPNNHTLGLKFAKRLVEAAKVLANENGRADPKQTAKNRERYVLDAHRIIKKMISAGSPDAMFYMADCYGQGSLGLQPDAKEAFNLYQSAAKIGHAQSAYRVAVCCELGSAEGGGTRRDHVKAVQYYKRAATLGDTPAMYKIGMILLKGLLGHPANPREAITWLKRAAERANAENPHALHELALLYESAKSTDIVLRDEAYAIELFTRAAELGYKYSQFRLGSAYEYGLLRCPIDPRQSIMWYTRAAAQGEHQSEFALSGWYLTGSPPLLEQNDTEAYLWARKSASSGLAKAEYAMGYYSEVGIGVQSDLNEAKKWYYRAAAQQHPKAQERLEQLNRGAGRMQKQKVSRSAVGSQHEGECTVM